MTSEVLALAGMTCVLTASNLAVARLAHFHFSASAAVLPSLSCQAVAADVLRCFVPESLRMGWQEAVLLRKSCELHAVVDVCRSPLPPGGGCLMRPPAWGPDCIVDVYARVRPPCGADVWLKLPSSVRAPPALEPPAGA